jgi:hypothetical protein
MSAEPDGRLRVQGSNVLRVVIKPSKYRGWFKLRRAEGAAGVVLEIRIPGYRHEDLPQEDQGAAVSTANAIYEEYRQAVESLSGQ